MIDFIQKRRFLSGIWFAMFAAIPVIFFVLIFYKHLRWSDSSLLFTGLSPLLVAGLFGSLIGSIILNPEKIKSGLLSAILGIVVAILSYILFVILYALTAYIAEGRLDLFLLSVTVIYSLLYFGWLIVLSGALAGWSLFHLRKQFIKE